MAYGEEMGHVTYCKYFWLVKQKSFSDAFPLSPSESTVEFSRHESH